MPTDRTPRNVCTYGTLIQVGGADGLIHHLLPLLQHDPTKKRLTLKVQRIKTAQRGKSGTASHMVLASGSR